MLSSPRWLLDKEESSNSLPEISWRWAKNSRLRAAPTRLAVVARAIRQTIREHQHALSRSRLALSVCLSQSFVYLNLLSISVSCLSHMSTSAFARQLDRRHVLHSGRTPRMERDGWDRRRAHYTQCGHTSTRVPKRRVAPSQRVSTLRDRRSTRRHAVALLPSAHRASAGVPAGAAPAGRVT